MADDATYDVVVRPIVGLVCLPIWLLALLPARHSRPRWGFYLFMLLLWFYMTGITMVNPYQGERIRFPVLMFTLPVVLWHVQGLLARLRRGLRRRPALVRV